MPLVAGACTWAALLAVAPLPQSPAVTVHSPPPAPPPSPSPPAPPPLPGSPPPSLPPVHCADPVDGDVALTAYPSGTMLVYKEGEWGTVCRHYTQDSLISARVLCQQLGYEDVVEQRVTDEDVSAFPVAVWAIDCKEEPAPRKAPAKHGRPHKASHKGQPPEDASPPPAPPPPPPPYVRRLVDCHTHSCKHIHCGCGPKDALAVTCGGAQAPDFPQCGSAGALLPQAPVDVVAAGAADAIDVATPAEVRAEAPVEEAQPGTAAEVRPEVAAAVAEAQARTAAAGHDEGRLQARKGLALGVGVASIALGVLAAAAAGRRLAVHSAAADTGALQL